MFIPFSSVGRSLISKLILTVGLTALVSISSWSYFNIRYQKQKVMDNLAAESDRLSTTIKLGTHYAMMINSREDIAEIIKNISRQSGIRNIRIYNKEGKIKYSNQDNELEQATNIKDEACYICHRTEPPMANLALSERTRIFLSPQGNRRLGILSPIYNEPGCASAACHVHPEGKTILGALDVVVSLKETDQEISGYQRTIIFMTMAVILLTSAAILIFVLIFVRIPIKKLIAGTRLIVEGLYFNPVTVEHKDEMGELAAAINQMGREIGEKQMELNRKREEYQTLFELVPCLITVQDRDFRLQNYNQAFAEKFNPHPGDFCYKAYKGLEKKCNPCPVEKTFREKRSIQSEETSVKEDGLPRHWMVITSPIHNAAGEIVAAMEISLDITQRKLLEEELEKSEKKYHIIFNNMPNSIFVLDFETLEILDCNDTVLVMYGMEKNEVIGRSFLELVLEEERKKYRAAIKSVTYINQARHLRKDGKIIFTAARISPTEYNKQKVLLVTTSDITKRLEAEHQLAQAGKLATLGEMATGVAHELNQPLSVIKTVSSFFMKKIKKNERVDDQTLFTMLSKVDSNVDRATKIITHMRLFARKTELRLVKVQINQVLEKAFEIFNQQLRVKGIEVVWDLEGNLPVITADPDRLEQVFINLLINARDAMEEIPSPEAQKDEKTITLKTYSDGKTVMVEVGDTGPGIPDELRDKVFDPFFTTKEVGKGTGLGLSISYGIVKECGGNISVAPFDGRGAKFLLEFPIKDEA